MRTVPNSRRLNGPRPADSIREYFGLLEYQRITILFYKLVTETSPESGCLNVFFTENQSRAFFRGLLPEEEGVIA